MCVCACFPLSLSTRVDSRVSFQDLKRPTQLRLEGNFLKRDGQEIFRDMVGLMPRKGGVPGRTGNATSPFVGEDNSNFTVGFMIYIYTYLYNREREYIYIYISIDIYIYIVLQFMKGNKTI
jgi:hypothetical protein